MTDRYDLHELLLKSPIRIIIKFPRYRFFLEDKIIREKITIEKVLQRIGERRPLLNNILRTKANWIDHILRRNCLLHVAIEGHMTEVKRVGR